MDSKMILDTFKAKYRGQLQLFEDYDLMLRNMLFERVNNTFDVEALIHWWMVVYIPNESIPKDVFRSWNCLHRYFKYTYKSGYNPKTNQSSIQLMCFRRHQTQPQADELKLWIPYIKPYNDCKTIPLFEHTLSEYESYRIDVYDDIIKLIASRGYRESTIMSSSDIYEVVNYVRQYYWYNDEDEKI